MKYLIISILISSLFINKAIGQAQCTLISIDHFGGNDDDVTSYNPGSITYPDGTFSLTISTGSTAGNIKTDCIDGLFFRHYNSDYSVLLNEFCAPIGTNFSRSTFYVYPQANGDTVLIGQSELNLKDYGIERRNALGQALWTKNYGGIGTELFVTAAPSVDSGFFIGGEAHSNDGDVGFHYGNYYRADIWIIKVDANGDTLWTKVLGGTNEERLSTLIPTDDGGCIIFGSTLSGDYDAISNHSSGSEDVYIAKLNNLGQVQWQQCYGGSSSDGSGDLRTVKAIKDGNGGFFVAATTKSIDGDIQRRMPMNYDFWLFHIDSLGTLLWENTFGGPNWEFVYDLCRATDGSLWLVGTAGGGGSANPIGGDVAIAYGGTDGWVTHTDSLGNFINSLTLGADYDEYIKGVHPLSMGNILVVGHYSNSVTPGSGSPNFPYNSNGEWDIFLALLSPQIDLNIKTPKKLSVTWEVYPNPVNNELTISVKNENRNFNLLISDAYGKLMVQDKFSKKTKINTNSWASGTYWVSISNPNSGQASKKIVILKH